MEKKQTQPVDLCDNIIRWSLITAVALLPLIVSPINYDAFDLPKAIFLYALSLTMGVSYLARSLLAGELVVKKNPLNKPLLAFAIMMTVATIASPIILISLIGEFARYENLFTIYSYLLVAFMAGQFMDKKEWLNKMVSILAISFGFVSLIGILQAMGIDIMPEILRVQGFAGRSRGTLGNPIFFGGYMAIMIPLFLNYLFDKKEGLPFMPKWALGLVVTLGFSGAILSQSRGALLAVIIGVLAVIALRRKELLRNMGTALTMIVFAVALTLLVLTIAGNAVLANTITSLADRATTLSPSVGSEASRIEIWKSSVDMISVRPLEGYGPDQMYVWSPAFSTLRKSQLEINNIPDRAHNIFLQTAINGGLISLLIFLWIIITLGLVSVKLIKNEESPYHNYILGAFAALIGYVAQGLSGIDVIGITVPVWVLAGTVAAVASTEKLEAVVVPFKIKGYSGIIIGSALVASVLVIFSLKPVIADTYYLNGVTYRLYGESDRSILEFNKAVNMYPYQTQYRRDLVIALVGQGNALKDAGLVEKGITIIDEGLSYNPKDFDLILSKAGAYRIYASLTNDQDMVGQAQQYYGEAISINPYSTNPRRGLLGLYFLQEKYADVIEQANVVLQVDPNDNDVKYRLAQAYEKTGKYGRAKRLYREILKSNPDKTEIKAALSRIE